MWLAITSRFERSHLVVKYVDLTLPDGLIRICSAYPSGNLPLENFWEGVKILVS